MIQLKIAELALNNNHSITKYIRRKTKLNKTKTILFKKKSMFKQNVLFDWGIKKIKKICNAALN